MHSMNVEEEGKELCFKEGIRVRPRSLVSALMGLSRFYIFQIFQKCQPHRHRYRLQKVSFQSIQT